MRLAAQESYAVAECLNRVRCDLTEPLPLRGCNRSADQPALRQRAGLHRLARVEELEPMLSAETGDGKDAASAAPDKPD